MKFNFYKDDIEKNFVEEERELELGLPKTKKNKTGAKIATAVIVIGLAGIMAIGTSKTVQEDISIQNAWVISEDMSKSTSYGSGIYDITTEEIAKLELEGEGRFLIPNKDREITLCENEDLETALTFNNMNMININGEYYSTTGTITKIEYEEQVVYGVREIPAEVIITKDENGNEICNYVAPDGYILQGDKAIATIAPTAHRQEHGTVYTLPEGYTLQVELHKRTKYTEKKFETKDELLAYIHEEIGASFTLDDVTITEYEVKTFAEIPTIYQSKEDKTLRLK